MPDFKPKQILFTPDALNKNGEAVAAKYPDAVRLPIKQHNRLPELDDMQHYKAKSDLLVLGRLKTREIKYSGRSSDFISPSLANGCYGGCAYCYVDRHKSLNPITVFTNTDEIIATVEKHVMTQPWPRVPNQTDPQFYTYDIGCNSDVSIDYDISPGIADVFQFYKEHTRAKATFATKFVNHNMLDFDPQRKIRIRFSLMPTDVSKLVDVRTDSIEKRLQAINDFYAAGYEVHVNFSPVIVYDRLRGVERDWEEDYRELFRQLNAVVSTEVKKQMQSEVIFLTHNEMQHLANLNINPKAEELLWLPELQETKRSSFGGINIRYQHQLKARMIDTFINMLTEEIPWCGIRYIF
ncbi:spore photoproduct lyase family protein [Mucilaginibacter lacusdianchii]|uniref:spore photoproduct lyase family protein n=1 Tax=Mucilaginibacter lacusdianchii TaxID=2684211 RepID=UPI00131B6314|nr:spore photoproduct lyase family protein [Mucilaginibacter sp. JXJ CY 39]